MHQPGQRQQPGELDRLINCTVSGNSASAGGGISGNATLDNTIVAHAVSGGDIQGTASGSHNLIDDAATAGGLTTGASGNIVGVDPKLGALGYDGGRTQTIALLAGSPAIGAGDITLLPPGTVTDQRGVSRFNGNSVDIGAVESGPKTIAVTTLVDEDNGTVDPLTGTGTSLREAISLPNADPGGGDTIIFSPLLKGALLRFHPPDPRRLSPFRLSVPPRRARLLRPRRPAAG